MMFLRSDLEPPPLPLHLGPSGTGV
jgi:hypothetical protein